MQNVEKLPLKQQEQIASSILKRKLDLNKNSVSSGSSSNTKNVSLDLSTSGRKMKITVNPKKEEKIVFNTENLDNYGESTGASGKEMKKITNFLRSNAGKKSVPSFYRNHASDHLKQLKNIYKNDVHEFDAEKKFKEKRPVVWADATELLEAVMVKRGITNGVLVKLMLDGGQNFF